MNRDKRVKQKHLSHKTDRTEVQDEETARRIEETEHSLDVSGKLISESRILIERSRGLVQEIGEKARNLNKQHKDR